MITVKKALEICKEAHKNQWRTPTTLNGDLFLSYGDEVKNLPYHEDDHKILSDGSIIRLDGSQSYSKPYYTHPVEVADMFESDELKICSLLHDLLEDSFKYKLTYLNTGVYSLSKSRKQIGYVSKLVGDILKNLTHIRGYTYERYIVGITGEPNPTIRRLGVLVKIADITSNLTDNPSKHAKQKYRKAMKLLLSVL